jgi:Flp pilus assembly protein TadB
MELLLKRNEKWGALGKRYDLFAKIELKPEEQALMRKAKPEKVVIWEDDYAANNMRWRLMLLPAGIGAIILGFLSALIHPLLVLPVIIIAWFTLRKMLFMRRTPLSRQFETKIKIVCPRY